MKSAITFRQLDTPQKRERALIEMMEGLGFRVELIGDEEFLIPIDPEHPDYLKCARKAERARSKFRSSQRAR